MNDIAKRTFDLALSSVGLLLASPLLVLVAIAIRMKLGSPVFFVQRRSGAGGIPFDMIKFRTMTNAVDAMGNLLPNSERMTTFGNFLRKTSLDELPELWNVLRGEMSLVGPRPLLPEYDKLYSDEHAKRLTVRPGLTGLAQVNGRSASSWSERFDHDVHYVENQSLWLDIKILFSTVRAVIVKDGVTTPDLNKRFDGYGE
ncbi:Exopolysaccharide production protein ExoY [Altererythrobacter insulae]|nr:Exopolysaccharide production protein ExoY [Altererythrobacter insulae]